MWFRKHELFARLALSPLLAVADHFKLDLGLAKHFKG
jgi:hypothetical protein